MEQPFILVDDRAAIDLDRRTNLVRLSMRSGAAHLRIAMTLHDMMMLAALAQQFCHDALVQQQDAEVIPFTVIGRV